MYNTVLIFYIIVSFYFALNNNNSLSLKNDYIYKISECVRDENVG